MFKRWFERRGRMPLAVDPRYGHIGRFVQRVFGCTIDELDTEAVIADGAEFERLCRVIMLTEQRGDAQVEILLRSRAIRSDLVMFRIFAIIHHDEPGHLLMLVMLPALFLEGGAARLSEWPDAEEIASA